MNIKSLGKRIQKKRLEVGISQSDLAMKSDLCRASIMRMERGKHIPRFDKMIKILRAIDMPISAAI